MKPTIDEIREMTYRFYSAETTLDEEKYLIHFFTTETDIPEDLQTDAAIFQTFDVPEQDAFLNDLHRVIRENMVEEK